MKFFRDQAKGFSLVELMVVVGIIGVLTAIALPRYQLFQARAKQSEAKMNLAHIHMMQTTYHMDHNTYTTSFANLRINMQRSGGVAAAQGRYYTFAIGTGSATAFSATANAPAGIIASCAGIDEWTMNQDKNLTNNDAGLDDCT